MRRHLMIDVSAAEKGLTSRICCAKHGPRLLLRHGHRIGSWRGLIDLRPQQFLYLFPLPQGHGDFGFVIRAVEGGLTGRLSAACSFS